jgi:hypothetical protein
VKKVVAIFFVVIYGFASIGATVHTHYCMGKYVGTTLLESKDSKCGKCGMKEDAKKKGCCKDEHKEFKLKTDQQKSNVTNISSVNFAPALLSPITNYNVKALQNNKFASSNLHPPPIIQKLRLHILYAVFLI